MIGGSILGAIIVAIVVVGAIAILYIAAKAAGIPIPAWLPQIVGVVVLVFVAVLAIKLLAGMF